MSSSLLLSAIGIMSLIVALEAVWLMRKYAHQPPFVFLSKPSINPFLRAVYYLGLPYLLLLVGVLPARHLGLIGLEYLIIPPLNQPISVILTILLNQIGNILLSWSAGLGSMVSTSLLLGGTYFFFLFQYLRSESSNWSQTDCAIYHSKLDVIFDVAHWTFYRAIFWIILDSSYLGALGGILLILIEYAAASRIGNLPPEWKRQALFRFMLGLITSIVFIFSPNFWFILILHGLLAVLTEAAIKLKVGADYKTA